MFEIRHEKMDRLQSTQEAYNQIYTHEGILHRDSFYLWLIGLLGNTKGGTLIDISTGQGRLVTLAQASGTQSVGVDFAAEGVVLGKQESPQSDWAIGDGEILPFARASFDYVTHIGSLEHYLNLAYGAGEIARVLKPKGKAVILLPNAFGLWGNIKYVYSHGEIFDDGQPLQRYATRCTWESILTGAGLKVEKVVGYNEIPFPKTFKDLLWLAAHPLKIIRGILGLFIPLNLSNHFVFICTHD